ncbi:MAG: matrixin family metalloprotease [Acetobacteraceae bacterium]|nr:matrixin family metalloprotease [Acetobacteraceae bacterium]
MTTTSADPDLLLTSGGGAWRGGGPLLLTYSFAADGADAVGNQLASNAWAPFFEAQRESVRMALDAWAAISGLSFLEVPDTPSGAGIDLRFRLEDLGGPAVFGRSWGPGDGDTDGDIALNLRLFRTDSLAPSATRIGFALLLHEIGHAIGLGHPAESSLDSRDLTVMSVTPERLPLPVAPRTLDALAAQALYGTEAEEQALGLRWSWDATLGAVRGEGTAGDDRLVGPGWATSSSTAPGMTCCWAWTAMTPSSAGWATTRWMGRRGGHAAPRLRSRRGDAGSRHRIPGHPGRDGPVQRNRGL